MTAVAITMAGLAGCTAGGRSPQPAPGSAAASPTGLAAAVQSFGATSYRFKVVAKEGSYAGSIDPGANVLDASVSVSSEGNSLKIDTINVRGVPYTRITGLPLPGFDGQTWYKVDPARVTKPGALGLSAIKDPTGVRALIAATHDVHQESRTYRGTVDMTKVVAWGPVNVAQVMQLGEPAHKIPFEATVDESNRVTGVKVAIPGNPVEATYSDFGAPVTVQEPRSAEPLPDHLYGLLGL